MKKNLTYSDAGVNIDAGNELVQRIKPAVKSTTRPGCLGSLGGFGGLFEMPLDRYHKPILVSGTDGVGTKLKLAIDLDKFDTIGIDLVAMCANDIATLGAEALFFLDYYATGKLNVDHAEQVINGIAKGCKIAGCALIGGETAEMPGIYSPDDFDLAGFCVGVVGKADIITGEQVKPGDKLIALASSGPHSNGFSLIRKIIETSGTDLSKMIGLNTLAELLMEPTRIYVKNMLKLTSQISVLAAAHITGGGLTENIPRILPANCKADIDYETWQVPLIFHWIQTTGNISQAEMLRTFNCGVGMVLVVKPEDLYSCLNYLDAIDEYAWEIGIVKDK